MGYLEFSLIFMCALGVAGQVDPLICDPQCINGGTCYESTCLCPGGYRGEYCQIPPSPPSTTPEAVTDDPPTTGPMVPTPPPPAPPAPSIFPSTDPITTSAPPITTTMFPTTTRIPVTPTKPAEEPTPMIPTPPPPPPPSPSLFLAPPVSSTPMPSTEPMTTMTTRLRSTMTPRHTTRTAKPTRPAEPDPVLIELGGVTVTLEFPPQEFDQEEEMKFKSTIAKNVNEFCSSEPGNCLVEGIVVGSKDVVTYSVRGVSLPEVAAILEMDGTDTVVEFYVTYGDGTEVVLNSEQLDTMLVDNSDKIADELGYGFQRGAPEPVTGLQLDWWAILLICVGGVLILIIMGYGLIRNTRVDEGKNSIDSDSDDVEMQDTVKQNGGVHKDTQASQSDILTETKHVFNHYSKEPTADTSMSTQVSADDIVKETGFDQISPAKQPITENNNSVLNVTKASLTVETNGNALTVKAEVESPVNVTMASLDDDFSAPPAELQRMPSIEAAAVGEIDKLINEQVDNPDNTFDNPAFTEADEDDKPRTEL